MAKNIAKFVSGNVSPRFEHDCDKCKFLGILDGNDLYSCVEGNMGRKTYIVRDGNDGPEYRSMPAEAVRHFPDGIAYKLAEILDNKSDNKPNRYVTIPIGGEEIKY